ncbi:hypothetical protein XU18_4114 [Perkinsela sp. CCAP 1560/4]|nr:hypothetical protein XU18_4114 [Perkinsela sp. CCAP 1560/4]|eukprot:KNH04702.1 hypothetical protein XU18_4114 [Perkinsela sp. CCAP 1560/4]
MSHESDAFQAMGAALPTSAAQVSTIMDMGVQYGKGYFREHQGKFVSGFLSPIESFRPYFFINDAYLRHKLTILVFPFRHTFTRKTASDAAEGVDSDNTLPVSDTAAPDLYIPIVSLCTLGLLRSFRSLADTSCPPEAIFTNLTAYWVVWGIQTLFLKTATLLSSIPIAVAWLDVISWTGYIHIPLILTAMSDIASQHRWEVSLVVSMYICTAWAYFFYRTLENMFCYTKRSVVALYLLTALQIVIFYSLRARFFVV